MSATIGTQTATRTPARGAGTHASASSASGSAKALATPATPAAATSSSTVSLSSEATSMLKGLGTAVLDVAQGALGVATDVVDVPLDALKDVATGIGSATGEIGTMTKDLSAGSFSALGTAAKALASDLFVTLPAAVGADVAKDTRAVAADAATLASGVVGLGSLGTTDGTALFSAIA